LKLLLDTHVFIWWDRQLRRLPRDLRAAIEDGTNQIFVSAASVWEIAIKRALGKLVFSAPIAQAVQRLGFDLLPITAEHAAHAGGLPLHHRDPFDRLIIAQAVLEGLVLATHDPRIRPYGVATLGLDPAANTPRRGR